MMSKRCYCSVCFPIPKWFGEPTFDEIYDSLPEWRKCMAPAEVRNK